MTSEARGSIQASEPLRDFIHGIESHLATDRPREEMVQGVKGRLVGLLQTPGWLPAPCRIGDSRSYARHLLYRQPGGGFCMVAMVWGPGQQTPVHDHAGVWCVEGVYEGLIQVTRYDLRREEGDQVHFARGEVILSGVGACGALIPPVEYHQMANPTDDTAISVHVYGRDLEVCHAFQPLHDDVYLKQLKRLHYNSIVPLAV